MNRTSRFRICFLTVLGCCVGFSLRAQTVATSNSPSASAVPTQAQPATQIAGDTVRSPRSLARRRVIATPGSQDADTNAPGVTAEPGQLPPSGFVEPAVTSHAEMLRKFQLQLDVARRLRVEKSASLASTTLIGLLETNAPTEIKRQALFELALVAQDQNQFVKAQQIFAQYLNRYPEDPSVPEVLLRQGLLYRQMGVFTLAVSKFYAVMSSALKLNLSNIDYYKKLVLQAQGEIADTFYQQGQYAQAADFFGRLLKSDATELNKPHIEVKMIRSLSCLTNDGETIARAELFLERNAESDDVPEVRFLLASALKRVGRNQESLKQVLLLLQSQADKAGKEPETWVYWQQRAGNEIANQLYKEGDYLNALQIYLTLADLNKSPSWQLPIWYQIGLVYEQLEQWQKATDTYRRILDRRKELTDAESTPSLLSLFDMAKWRNDYIAWMEKSKATNLTFHHAETGRQPAPVSQ